MTNVMLVHCGETQHYRIPVYTKLAELLKSSGFSLTIVTEGLQKGVSKPFDISHYVGRLSVLRLTREIVKSGCSVVIFFGGLRYKYALPTYFIAKYILSKKVIYWGHGSDLAAPQVTIKNWGYWIEQAVSDAIILYADHLMKYIPERFHDKCFIAANTLCPPDYTFDIEERISILENYGIKTRKNIVCVGRMQRRKRIENLIAAHNLMGRDDVGLILVGPDCDGILQGPSIRNVSWVDALYGSRLYRLLSSADVFCLPGAIGLSIVDAFNCGLPIVTEAGDESPEISYLKDGKNGFIVPKGDIESLAKKLILLLDDDSLRERFSVEAKREAIESASIEKMCEGFRDALLYVT
ncbi:MAG: glycosyltransferase family 4 protein [Deltaproteobacteria bacterium]|nr:glycosyltransferase family 4 protein [Deltaproteobacteria bacterium]